MRIDIKQAAQLLLNQDDILILVHQNPDGDTTGSGFGLKYALKQLGKRVMLLCPDPFPSRFSYLIEENEAFNPKYVVSVDVADTQLLGGLREQYPQIDLCIDHHPSNTLYARNTLLVPEQAATCEIVYKVIRAMGVTIDTRIGECIYTGMATDTGCFKFSNTTAESHRIAAELFEVGIDFHPINKRMFDTKSKGKLAVERRVMDTLEYHFNDRMAMLTVTSAMLDQVNEGCTDPAECVTLDEIDGSVSMTIKGVRMGVMIKQKGESLYKISIRTDKTLDASAICRRMGGGGHARAAGCTLKGRYNEIKARILEEAGKEFTDGKETKV